MRLHAASLELVSYAWPFDQPDVGEKKSRRASFAVMHRGIELLNKNASTSPNKHAFPAASVLT